MPTNLSITDYESRGGPATIFGVKGHRAVVIKREDSFALSLDTGMTLLEVWSSLGPHLSRPKENDMARHYPPLPDRASKLPSREVIEDIWEFSNYDVEYLNMQLDEDRLVWRRDEFSKARKIALVFNHFQPEVFKSALSMGDLAICGAADEIVKAAGPLLESYS